MKIVDNEISVEELKKMPEKMFDNLVKAVVDIEKEIMVVDAIMHADQESLLLDEGSKQENLWGINLYLNKIEEQDFIEFDSMINIRARQDNRGRGVYDPKIREKIIKIVNKLVKK
ncbi:DUF5674 family protein [Candidatus Dependentiae bacterium]